MRLYSSKMGIYYGEDGSFTSTLDIRPITYFTKYNNDLNLDISLCDFMRVCNVLNIKKKDTIAAIIIQRWCRHIIHKKYKRYKNAVIIIEKWWKKVNERNNENKMSIWNFLWFL